VLIAATIFAILLWRYYKKHEERFLDEAEAAAGEMLEQQHKSAPDGWPQT
jgi:hypothetical protein